MRNYLDTNSSIMESFQNIKIVTQCDVVLHQGKTPGVEIIASESTKDWVECAVRNGELIIFTRPQYYGFLLMSGDHPKVNITCNFLMGIEVLDKAKISSANMLQTHRLGLIVKAGNIKLNLNIGFLDLAILKKAYVKVEGICLTSNILIHNQGIYDGFDLDASETSLYMNNGANAKVFTTEHLELRMFRRSSLTIAGNPRMNLQHLDDDCSIKVRELEPSESYKTP